MSFVDFKEISVNNPGTSIRYGGDDLKGLMQILNGKILSQKRPRILNEWLWLNHFDMAPPATVPAAPTDTNTSRIYVDPTNFKIKVKKTNDSIVDIENVDIPESALSAITTRAKLPSALAYEDEANIFTNSQTINRTSGVADFEILQTWRISDDSLSRVDLVNATNTDGLFVPWFRSFFSGASAGHPGLYLFSYIPNAQDSGTTPALIFDVRKDNNAAITTRSLYRFRNAAITVFEITPTQIDHTSKTLINPGNIVINNASNTFGLFDQIFKSSRLLVRNPADTFSYIIAGSAIAANRTLTIPPLTANDVMVTEAFAQALSNKTISPYIDFNDTPTPANPSTGFRRLFSDSANDSRLSILKSDGTVLNLESAAITTLDSLTDVVITTPAINQVPTWDGTNWVNATPPGATGGESNTGSNVGTAGVGIFKQKVGVDLSFKKINAASNKVTITDDTGNDEVDVDVTQANLDLNSIGGAISTRSKLPTPVVYDDEANTYGDFDQIFLSSRLKVRDSDNTHSYVFVGSDLAADRLITLPLLAANDSFVLESHGQTLTNKTIDADLNTLSNIENDDIKAAAGIVYTKLNLANSIGDADITAQTSTKITITAKSQLNAAIAYEDEANTFTNAQTLSSHTDIRKISPPDNPALEDARLSIEAIDANNNGLFLYIKEQGVIVKRRLFP